LQNVGEERVPLSEPTVEKITEAMYGVVNEPGGTGTALKIKDVELSGKIRHRASHRLQHTRKIRQAEKV